MALIEFEPTPFDVALILILTLSIICDLETPKPYPKVIPYTKFEHPLGSFVFDSCSDH